MFTIQAPKSQPTSLPNQHISQSVIDHNDPVNAAPPAYEQTQGVQTGLNLIHPVTFLEMQRMKGTALPNFFYRQAEMKLDRFVITHEMFNAGLFRMQVEEATYNPNDPDGVFCKLRLISIVNEQTNEIVPQSNENRGESLPKPLRWGLRMRTPDVYFNKADGLISPEMIDTLRLHADWYMNIANETVISSNSGLPVSRYYAKPTDEGFSNVRLYFSPSEASAEGEIQFWLEPRIAPASSTSQESPIGISCLLMTPSFRLIGRITPTSSIQQPAIASAPVSNPIRLALAQVMPSQHSLTSPAPNYPAAPPAPSYQPAPSAPTMPQSPVITPAYSSSYSSPFRVGG